MRDRDFSLLILCVFASCGIVTGQALIAHIKMGGINTKLEFSSSAPYTVTCTLSSMRDGFPMGQNVNVSFHSYWVDFDVADRCTDAQLGSALPNKEGVLNSQNAQSFNISGATLDSLEGRSVVITNDSSRYCATILKDGAYNTALASFNGVVYGRIYFRQFDDSDQQTIIFSNLISTTQFANPTWKVINSANGCMNLNTLWNMNEFNVNNQSPSVGDFVARVGTPLIGYPGAYNRTLHQTSNVTLSGSSSVVDKYLIVYDQSNPSTVVACSKIEMIKERRASVMFSNEGLTGTISFTQRSPFDLTHTYVNLRGLNMSVKGYHVHVYPVPVQTMAGQALCSNDIVAGHFNPFNILQFPSPTVGTDDQYEIGDLSSKYGTLQGLTYLVQNYTDMNLPLFGENSIIGRSVVIHNDDATNSRFVCANILPYGHVFSGVAVFHYPVKGHVYFTHSQDRALSDAWIFARLSYLDESGMTDTSGHMWSINENKVGLDMQASGSQRCLSAGDPIAPYNCTTPMCRLGYLGRRHGTLSIGTTLPSLAFYSDSLLNLAGSNSIIGKSVVIRNTTGSDILACATINTFNTLELKASLRGGQGLSGSVYFRQEPVFGARPATVNLMLSGYNETLHKVQIYSLPPMSDDGSCTGLGEVYNPLAYSGNVGTSDDQRAIGNDLLKSAGGSTSLVRTNLPLNGLTSIRQRSVVVKNRQTNAILACGLIQEPFSNSFMGSLVSARVTMGTPLQGYINLYQVLYNDGSTSDTSVVVNLSNEDNSQTAYHNWHVHVKPVSGDSSAVTGRCSSTGPHYDPFSAAIGAAATGYSMQCSKTNPLRCEIGDQANKLGAYSLGSGRKVYTDVALPLNGYYQVQGRSIVVHAMNRGAARLGCADVNPITTNSVPVEFNTPANLDLQQGAKVYAGAINAPEQGIVLELVSSTSTMTSVKVHFLGLENSTYRSRFLAFIASAANRNTLGDYAPLPDSNNASIPAFSMILLLITSIMVYVV